MLKYTILSMGFLLTLVSPLNAQDKGEFKLEYQRLEKIQTESQTVIKCKLVITNNTSEAYTEVTLILRNPVNADLSQDSISLGRMLPRQKVHSVELEIGYSNHEEPPNLEWMAEAEREDGSRTTLSVK